MNLAPSAGVGLKPAHFEAALAAPADGLWFEVHPENYMVEGGPRRAWLEAIRARHPLSLHGVGLSLAADAPPDAQHLRALVRLVDALEPALVSEHLAWSTWNGIYHPDLLPFPRTGAALARVAANVARTQDALKRTIAVENPSHYLQVDGHDCSEVDFLIALAQRTGCALLVDVNNVYVSARNTGMDAARYLDDIPAALVREIHLAGHSIDPTLGECLLIDSHDAPIAEPVWSLFESFVARIGARPTLIERDDHLPPFDTLLGERARAQCTLRALVEQGARA